MPCSTHRSLTSQCLYASSSLDCDRPIRVSHKMLLRSLCNNLVLFVTSLCYAGHCPPSHCSRRQCRAGLFYFSQGNSESVTNQLALSRPGPPKSIICSTESHNLLLQWSVSNSTVLITHDLARNEAPTRHDRAISTTVSVSEVMFSPSVSLRLMPPLSVPPKPVRV